VREFREKLGISQSDFAALFGFNVRSLRTGPPAAGDSDSAYLDVIRRDPEAVIRALRAA